MWTVTNDWTFDFEPDYNVGWYTLPNSVRIPLPLRGNMWPKRKTRAKFSRVSTDQGLKYIVLLTPVGKDTYWLRKFLIEQGTESLLSKAGAIMLGGLIGPALAGVATIFVPGETAKTLFWQGQNLRWWSSAGSGNNQRIQYGRLDLKLECDRRTHISLFASQRPDQLETRLLVSVGGSGLRCLAESFSFWIVLMLHRPFRTSRPRSSIAQVSLLL